MSYKVVSSAGVFKLCYYSFNALLLNGIDDIKPVKNVSQSLLMAQELLSFVLVGIMISLFLSYRTQRASSDLDNAIKAAEREASSTKHWLQNEFRIVSINKAIDQLREAESSLVKFIQWLSRGI